jgi:hypothetical protein
MNIDRIRLSAAIASLVSGLVGMLNVFGIVVDPDTEAQVHTGIFLATSIFAVVIPFVPSLREIIRRLQDKGI